MKTFFSGTGLRLVTIFVTTVVSGTADICDKSKVVSGTANICDRSKVASDRPTSNICHKSKFVSGTANICHKSILLRVQPVSVTSQRLGQVQPICDKSKAASGTDANYIT